MFVFVSLTGLLENRRNMKKLCAFLLGSVMAAGLSAQTSAVTTSINAAPKEAATTTAATDDAVLTLVEKEFNFGKIPQGKPVSHIFEVVNNGKDSLHIVNVVASCGCTTPEWEKDKVQLPGERTKITVGYNAASEGPFSKIITVTYNGTQYKQLTIRGEVWKTPVASAPENKELGNLKEK